MERVVIKQDSRIDTVLYGLYIVAAIFGGFILTGHIYDYFTGQLMEDWFWELFIGVIYFVVGTGLILGIFKPNQSEVILDEKGIHSTKTHWDQSFQWEKLKKVSLDKKSIQVQYKETGANDSIKLPFMLRFGNSHKLSDALTEGCNLNNVSFQRA